MWIFQHDGEAGFSGTWTTITSARAFDTRLLQPPILATHWVRFTGGATADLVESETVEGGTGSGTATIIAVIKEQGAFGSSNSAGTLLLRAPTGVPWVATEVLTGALSTGTVVASGPAVEIVSHGPAKALLITCQTATLQFSYSGIIPTLTAGTDDGMQLVSGGNFLLRGPVNIRKFQAINAANASGAIMKYVLHF